MVEDEASGRAVGLMTNDQSHDDLPSNLMPYSPHGSWTELSRNVPAPLKYETGSHQSNHLQTPPKRDPALTDPSG